MVNRFRREILDELLRHVSNERFKQGKQEELLTLMAGQFARTREFPAVEQLLERFILLEPKEDAPLESYCNFMHQMYLLYCTKRSLILPNLATLMIFITKIMTKVRNIVREGY